MGAIAETITWRAIPYKPRRPRGFSIFAPITPATPGPAADGPHRLQENQHPRRPSSFESYTRVGENLVVMGSSPVLAIHHVRSLTATSFTLESDYYSTLNPSSARTATSYIPFHR